MTKEIIERRKHKIISILENLLNLLSGSRAQGKIRHYLTNYTITLLFHQYSIPSSIIWG
jgi:hypothetical protein